MAQTHLDIPVPGPNNFVDLSHYQGTEIEKSFVTPDPTAEQIRQFHASLTPTALLEGRTVFNGIPFIRNERGGWSVDPEGNIQ